MEEPINENQTPGKVTITRQRYKILDDAFYFAEVVGWKEKQGNFGPNIVISYKVLDQGKFFDCFFNDLIHSKKDTGKRGRFCQLVKATFDRELQEADEFSLPDLIGKRCYAHVVRRGKNNAVTEYVSERTFADIRRSP